MVRTTEDLRTATFEGEVAGPGSTFVPGQILGERYRIESVLGRGGMGEVWQAYDLKLRVDVALKALLRDSSSDEASFELMRREVRSAREVISPNVCRIFDLVEVDGHELVSMEYVDGETLLSLLRSRGPLEPREAGKIAAQFLAGLEAIHQAGLVHRDVKPENIMITRAGRVVLMDFGIATRKADGVSGLRVGTPAYMSPEQARGEPVDARTDVYAAGLVLAELTCAEGLSDDSTRQTLWKALRHDPPAIPEGPWRRIVTRAVA
nr:protein kinase [Gammaproteobacteria bacterium]